VFVEGGRNGSGGSRKKYLGGLALIIGEATTSKRNYYRTNYKFGGSGLYAENM